MTHLSPDQIVDVAEGCAGGAVKAHAEGCPPCRAKVESLLDAVRLAESDPQPEPSPLVWPQLAARVNEAVRREQAPAAAWRPWAWWLAPAGAAALLLLAVGVAARFSTGTPVVPAVVHDGPAAAPMQASGEPAAGADPDDDPSWLLVIGLSAELSVDDVEASGTLPLPGGTDRALAHLDDTERAELARLLREEITARTPPALQGPGA